MRWAVILWLIVGVCAGASAQQVKDVRAEADPAPPTRPPKLERRRKRPRGRRKPRRRSSADVRRTMRGRRDEAVSAFERAVALDSDQLSLPSVARPRVLPPAPDRRVSAAAVHRPALRPRCTTWRSSSIRRVLTLPKGGCNSASAHPALSEGASTRRGRKRRASLRWTRIAAPWPKHASRSTKRSGRRPSGFTVR